MIIFDDVITRLLKPLHIPGLGIFSFITFLASLLLIALTLYGFAVFVRWMLRKLFWRVGRRLFLSYVLIGMLPFFLFAILLLTIGYLICGVMTHAALRGERLASLGQLETAAFEYSLTGKRPAGVRRAWRSTTRTTRPARSCRRGCGRRHSAAWSGATVRAFSSRRGRCRAKAPSRARSSSSSRSMPSGPSSCRTSRA